MSAPEYAKPKRAWQRMLSGSRLDLLEPSPDDIKIEDIAHGLARVARWNGQTTGAHAFSVAQHSLLVTDIVEALNTDFISTYKRAALLHDAPEYVIGDLISPFKSAIGLDYKAFELRLLSAIHLSFGIPAVLPAEVSHAIKTADRIAAFHEAICLAGFSRDEAQTYFGSPQIGEMLSQHLENIAPLHTREAQQKFLNRFEVLSFPQN